VILDHQHAHPNIVHHDTSHRHHRLLLRSALRTDVGVLHSCDQQPDTTSLMLKTTSRLPLVVALIAATTLIAACGSNSPTTPSGGRLTSTQLQRLQRDAVSFASCMRQHGVANFPDPTSDPRGFKFALSAEDTANAQSPTFQSALAACQHLMPARPTQNTYNPARTAALLAFAHCLRSHGFANFPDPSSSGEITHEMLANDGISLQQPGLLEAADTCVGVTHGVISKGDVARFAAGQ
jgi:hypothetical protein